VGANSRRKKYGILGGRFEVFGLKKRQEERGNPSPSLTKNGGDKTGIWELTTLSHVGYKNQTMSKKFPHLGRSNRKGKQIFPEPGRGPIGGEFGYKEGTFSRELFVLKRVEEGFKEDTV